MKSDRQKRTTYISHIEGGNWFYGIVPDEILLARLANVNMTRF